MASEWDMQSSPSSSESENSNEDEKKPSDFNRVYFITATNVTGNKVVYNFK